MNYWEKIKDKVDTIVKKPTEFEKEISFFEMIEEIFSSSSVQEEEIKNSTKERRGVWINKLNSILAFIDFSLDSFIKSSSDLKCESTKESLTLLQAKISNLQEIDNNLEKELNELEKVFLYLSEKISEKRNEKKEMEVSIVEKSKSVFELENINKNLSDEFEIKRSNEEKLLLEKKQLQTDVERIRLEENELNKEINVLSDEKASVIKSRDIKHYNKEELQKELDVIQSICELNDIKVEIYDNIGEKKIRLFQDKSIIDHMKDKRIEFNELNNEIEAKIEQLEVELRENILFSINEWKKIREKIS